jgi:hypothetical protein
MASKAFIFGGAVYGACALMTFGFFLRHGRPALKRRCLQAGAAALWPIYWLGFPTPKELLAVLASDEVSTLYLFISLFFPAFYLYRTADACTAFWSCAVVIFKALIWAPFWPAYLVAFLFLVEAPLGGVGRALRRLAPCQTDDFRCRSRAFAFASIP